MAKDINYKTGSETGWNMGEDYYKILANIKADLVYYKKAKNAEAVYICVDEEITHIYAYAVQEEKLFTELQKIMVLVEELIYKSNNYKGVQGEALKSVNESRALKLLTKARRILNIIEAKKGMLQPKGVDPDILDNKYGD